MCVLGLNVCVAGIKYRTLKADLKKKEKKRKYLRLGSEVSSIKINLKLK